MNIYSIKNKGVAGNIWKFALLAVTNKRPYLTFFSLYLLTMPNATTQTIGLIGFVSQIFGFLLEIPSGYLSDRIGHKNALIISKIFFFLATSILIFAKSKIFFFASAIFMSLAFAMTSGTMTAFFQETLDDLGLSERYSEINGKIRSVGFAIPILFILGLPLIAESFGYQVAFIVAASIDLIGLMVVLSLKNPQKSHAGIDEFEISESNNIFKNYMRIGWLLPVLFSVSIVGLSMGATSGFKNPFQESIGFSLSFLGVLWACSRVGISALLQMSSWLRKKFTLHTLLIFQALMLSLIYFLISFSQNKWLIAGLFICVPVLMWGLSSVKNHFLLDYIQGSKHKASYISINQFLSKLIQALFALMMGSLVFYRGYYFSYRVVALIMLAFVVVYLGVHFWGKNRKQAG